MAAVTRSGAGGVQLTTGLWGAGGFGKTTLAQMLAHRPEVREEFPDGVLWVIVGEDAAGPELAEKVTNAVCLLCGVRPPLTDPLAAGAELGRALGDRRVLLVVDDVWTPAQVEPFLIGGPATMRLFTTRIQSVLPASAELVQVHEMARTEAEQLLTAGVRGGSSSAVEGLLEVTGRWPMLLALVNGAVRDDQRTGRQAEDSMREILSELRTRGPTVLDRNNINERRSAVAMTIEVSLARLSTEERDRYQELAVFGKDTAIPCVVLARYWNTTGDWSAFQTRRYCQRLAELALVSDCRHDHVVLHDVIRAYLRELTKHRRGELHRVLVDAHRSLIPVEGHMSTWWQLPAEQSYLWAWLPTHLQGAGLHQELRQCLHHPGWLIGKLEHAGPAGLEADLALSNDPLSQALGATVRQNAHVLEPLEPSGSLAATLASRLPSDGATGAIATDLVNGITVPHLRAITALPDLPHPALARVLTGHTGWVYALAVAPDGSWLASAGYGGEVRIWDPAAGTLHHILTGHTITVGVLAVEPDGAWLASADNHGEVRIWDLATGTSRHILTGHASAVFVLAVTADGSWLASADKSGEVRIWDPAGGTLRHLLTGHINTVSALTVAPDGSWLASADNHGEVRIWDLATGTSRHILTGHASAVFVLAVTADGSWLASADAVGEVRIWDPATGALRCVLTSPTSGVTEWTVAPYGAWLACMDNSGEVRIWDLVTSALRSTPTGHTTELSTLALSPDGSWLASADKGGDVRTWDLATGTALHVLTGHTAGVAALAVAPDGSWLASADLGGEVRVWNPATPTARHTPTTYTGEVTDWRSPQTGPG